ncbi:hypothetical protein Patl1_21336 [Pistacia atlantica]|uniref:Uncharacterized protein n=1 Tax=Pistacia atlantica TaxID=434234 RepID=A0ACC1BIT5_9ROSI|nr:hypothetical protein Patl1_21336 [Pistacia atlantica]
MRDNMKKPALLHSLANAFFVLILCGFAHAADHRENFGTDCLDFFGPACNDGFDTGGMTRKSFPDGFIFGTATSAYQVEGMASKDGRGPSIWDVYVHQPGHIAKNATGEVAVDQYHRYNEDIDLMKKLNFEAYRFSISWSRIFPKGTGKVNWKGVAYYNRLINAMLDKGITPYANLYHYDIPLALQEKYNGLLDCQVVSKKDNNAAQRARDFHIGWFLHPFTYGEYPKTMQEIVGERLPKFTPEEVLLVKGSIDYMGVNQYTTYYTYEPDTKPQPTAYSNDWNAIFAYDRRGEPVGPRANSPWLYMVPWGLYNAVTYVKERYGNPIMFLSENGMDDPDNLTFAESLHDTTRINYYRDYISQLKKAIDDGANVQGYFAWSLLDNFEWLLGYTARFGIVYVDFNTLKRTPKMSAYWFKQLAKREE